MGLLIESNDLLFDDKCKFDIERVTAVEPNFRNAVSAEAAPKLLRLSALSCDPDASDLDDVGVPGKSLIDLRTFAGIVILAIFDIRLELISFVDNRRGFNDCGNACCENGK